MRRMVNRAPPDTERAMAADWVEMPGRVYLKWKHKWEKMMSSKLRETTGDSTRKNMDVVSFHAEFFVACQNETPTCTDAVTPAAPSDSSCWHTSQWSFAIVPGSTLSGLHSDHHPGNGDFLAVLYFSHTSAQTLRGRIILLSSFLSRTTAAELRRLSDGSRNNTVTFWHWSPQPQQRCH